jgi:hypothetical protein
MSDLSPIAERLGKLVRLLASDRDGEVVAAVRGLRRTLASAGMDFHGLAALVEKGTNGANGNEKSAREHVIATECFPHRTLLNITNAVL